jgi:1,4-alpha-glucan branching enzyme
VFAYWNNDVNQYLVDNARFLYEEYRIDGLRFDQVSVMDRFGGWATCQNLTSTLRTAKPEAIQIAEYWPVNSWTVRDRADGGAGFDATWSDGVRDSVRAAIASASHGAGALVSMTAIAGAIEGHRLRDRWRAVQMIENHDLVYAGRDLRIARLADGSNPRSWYARSRSRVAFAGDSHAFHGSGASGGRAVERYARHRHVDSMGRARSRRQDNRRFPAFYTRTDRPAPPTPGTARRRLRDQSRA